MPMCSASKTRGVQPFRTNGRGKDAFVPRLCPSPRYRAPQEQSDLRNTVYQHH